MADQNQLDEVLRLVREMSAKVDSLEAEVAALKQHHAEIPEDVLMAICAAVSAYLGNRARVRAVHFKRGQVWTSHGLSDVQHHNVSHPR